MKYDKINRFEGEWVDRERLQSFLILYGTHLFVPKTMNTIMFIEERN